MIHQITGYAPYGIYQGRCSEHGAWVNLKGNGCLDCLAETPPPLPFAPGVSVTAFGCNGVIKRLSDNGMFLLVKFDDCPDLVVFTLEGKLFSWAKEPQLKAIE